MISLAQLPSIRRPPEHRVGCQPDRTWGELRRLVSQIQPRLPTDSTQPWLLAVDDTFEFTAALLACWQTRVRLLISPDTQPGTLAQLRPLIGGCLTDRPVALAGIPIIQFGNDGIPSSGEACPDTAARGNHSPNPSERLADEVALELFTSGSTGARKRVPKTFAQLDHELAALQQQWGGAGRGQTTCATVSHLHIYGLLFKVLWPLCRGDALPGRSSFYWEELLSQLPDGPATIISSPAHLRHLPQMARQFPRAWEQTRIFSSGGPLPLETALAVRSACGQAPVEVYGSTETGGIAWRQQAGDGAIPWQPLPGVTTKLEAGLLLVRSPCLAEAGQWFPTGDRAEPSAGSGFQLLGRADRIAKITEKRVSLAEMEAKLGQHPQVSEARTFVLPALETSGRAVLGAVIELNAVGAAALAALGKAAVATELKRHLRPHFEAVTIPRRWRFVTELPRDAQGKVAFDSLLELFAATKKPTEPIVLQRERTPNGSLLRLQVPENLACLEGHFPRLAVVPGVCQLKWVTEEIAAFTGQSVVVTAMTAVKFHELLRPGQQFSLEFGFHAQTGKWNYRLFCDERTISSGRLQFAP